MTVLATISAIEHQAILEDRYINQYFEVLLLDAPGTTYTPGTTDEVALLANEVTAGTGGYKRRVFTYETGDISAYVDRGLGLATKAAVFPHDGSGTAMNFTHVALVRGTGNVISLDAATATPTAGVEGVYEGIATTTNGSGTDATLDITVSSDLTTFIVTVSYPGYGYSASDVLTVSDATLASLGIITAGAGNLTLPIANVSSDNAGNLVSVSATSDPVSLANGNEAVFYFNVKHFGYSTNS